MNKVSALASYLEIEDRKMRSLYKAIVSLAFCGIVLISGCYNNRCSSPPRIFSGGQSIIDVNVYIAPEFNERERANIINGIALWERATNGLIVWRLLPYADAKESKSSKEGVEYRSVLFKYASSFDDWVVKWDSENSTKQKSKSLLGLCERSSSTDVIKLWLVENRLLSSKSEMIVAAHEFGHALGLDHVENVSSTLSESYNKDVNCISIHDLREFCKRYYCDATIMVPTCRSE
jgi:hypothetical protein